MNQTSLNLRTLPGVMTAWVAAMAWHIWRCATLRPAFEKLSDTPVTALSFMAVYYAAGLYRHVWERSLLEALVGLSIYAILLGFIFMRSSRSDSLFCAVLAISAGCDIVFGTAALLGIDLGWAALGSLLLYEIPAMVITHRIFTRQPEYVQSCGYGRHPKS